MQLLIAETLYKNIKKGQKDPEERCPKWAQVT